MAHGDDDHRSHRPKKQPAEELGTKRTLEKAPYRGPKGDALITPRVMPAGMPNRPELIAKNMEGRDVEGDRGAQVEKEQEAEFDDKMDTSDPECVSDEGDNEKSSESIRQDIERAAKKREDATAIESRGYQMMQEASSRRTRQLSDSSRNT